MAQYWPLAFTHFEISRSPADRSSKVTTVPGHGPTVARTPGNLCGRNTGGHTGVRAGQRGAAPPARQSRAARPRVHSHTDTDTAAQWHSPPWPPCSCTGSWPSDTPRHVAMTPSDTWPVCPVSWHVTRDSHDSLQPGLAGHGLSPPRHQHTLRPPAGGGWQVLTRTLSPHS